MSEIGNEISALLTEPGQGGADMTHKLKLLGNGSMQKGINIIAEFFKEEGQNVGELRGIVKGSVSTVFIGAAVFGTVHLIKEQKKKEEVHKAKGKKIYTVLNKVECDDDQSETAAIA